MLSTLINNIGVKSNRDGSKFYIYAISNSDVKVFFTGDDFSEDINDKVETDDFQFAYNALAELLSTEEMRDKLEASVLF